MCGGGGVKSDTCMWGREDGEVKVVCVWEGDDDERDDVEGRMMCEVHVREERMRW